MNTLLALTLLLAADPVPAATSPTPAAQREQIDAIAEGEKLAAAFEKTTALVDSEIDSELVNGPYRIGLVLAPPRPIRPRSAGGRFTDPIAPDRELTFVGVVVRDQRTKRFLPEVKVTVNLEYEGGGDSEVPELAGAYPIYGANLRIGKDFRGVTVTIAAPNYDRHAEMLAAFTEPATVRFEVKPGAKKGPGKTWEVADAKKPAPHPADWTPGNDLRQAVGESRGLVRHGEWLVGFIAEGPEPYWFWREGATPEHCAVKEKDTNHLEAIAIHEPTGLMVTSATAILRFSRPPAEHHDFLLRPLLAEFFHYGGNFEVPPGTWTVTVLVDPPRHDAWGETSPYVPERRILGGFEYVREGVAGPPTTPQEEAKAFSDRLAIAAQRYAAGERDAASLEVTEAFFDFEGSKLDARLRASDPSGYKALEQEWIALRGKMKAGGKPMEIGVSADRVGRALVAYAANLEEGKSTGSTFVQSLVILVREGVEAILVLGLLVAVLRKTKREESIRLVWSGAGAALAVSIVVGLLFVGFMRHAGAAQEGIEGIVNLVAMLVLFFTSYWLISRVEGRRWASFIKNQIEGALTAGRRTAIVSLAFLVVFREGAETVLMYTPLVMGGEIVQVLAGIAVASVILTVIFIGWVVLGMKFPVRPFFGVSGALLYLLAFKFAGDGVAELQAAGWLSFTEVAWIPKWRFLQDWLGVRPSLESAALQAALLLAVAAGIGWTFLRRDGATAETHGAVAG